MAILNLAAYAKHRGCSYQAVQQAITNARIQIHHKKRRSVYIDSDAADAAWLQNTDSKQQRIPTRGERCQGLQTQAGEGQPRQAKNKHSLQPPAFSNRSFKALETYLPAGTCEPEFSDIMAMVHKRPDPEQRGVALATLASICRGLGAQEPGLDAAAQIAVMELSINRLPEAQRPAGTFELIERLAGRLAEVVDPAEQWQG